MLSIRQNNLLKNRRKILSLKHENYLRAVKAELRDKQRGWKEVVEFVNAFKRKYDKDKRLGRKPTFKESEIKEASEKMYKSHAMMNKFKQVCNTLENLQHKK